MYLELDTQVTGHSNYPGPLDRSRFLTTSEAAAEAVPNPVTEELRLLVTTRGVSEAKRSYVFISRSSKILILSILLFFFADLDILVLVFQRHQKFPRYRVIGGSEVRETLEAFEGELNTFSIDCADTWRIKVWI